MSILGYSQATYLSSCRRKSVIQNIRMHHIGMAVSPLLLSVRSPVVQRQLELYSHLIRVNASWQRWNFMRSLPSNLATASLCRRRTCIHGNLDLKHTLRNGIVGKGVRF